MWRLLNDRYIFLRHQLHFQKKFRFPGVYLQRGTMSMSLTYTHHCSSETSCLTHWPLDFVGLKLPEEFGATYGKLYCSAALSNFQPSGPQVSCTIKKGMQSNQCTVCPKHHTEKLLQEQNMPYNVPLSWSDAVKLDFLKHQVLLEMLQLNPQIDFYMYGALSTFWIWSIIWIKYAFICTKKVVGVCKWSFPTAVDKFLYPLLSMCYAVPSPVSSWLTPGCMAGTGEDQHSQEWALCC